jgi:hypothetical protein
MTAVDRTRLCQYGHRIARSSLNLAEQIPKGMRVLNAGVYPFWPNRVQTEFTPFSQIGPATTPRGMWIERESDGFLEDLRKLRNAG